MDRRLNICVDIDGTITEPFYWIQSVNNFFNKNIRPEQVTSYDFNDLCEISHEEFMAYYKKHGEEIHAKAEIREDADVILNQLVMEDNIYYITARMEQMKYVTQTWFDKYNVPYTEVFFLGSHDKLSKAIELDCDIFIEDRYENAIQLSEAGIFVLLIDCEYNRKELNERVKRVYSWQDIYEEIRRYKERVVQCLA